MTAVRRRKKPFDGAASKNDRGGKEIETTAEIEKDKEKWMEDAA
jgi:hypothetical protein